MKTAQAHNDQLTGSIVLNTPTDAPISKDVKFDNDVPNAATTAWAKSKSDQDWKMLTLAFVLQHQQRFNSSQADAFEAVRGWLESKLGVRAFTTLDNFKKFKRRHPRVVQQYGLSPSMSPINDEIDLIFGKLQDSVPTYGGVEFWEEMETARLRLVKRDEDRPQSSRINEMDELDYEERYTLFLKEVVKVVNEHLKNKKPITLEEIKRDCARRREQSAKEFERELASDPPEII